MNPETLRAHALTDDPCDEWAQIVASAEYPELVVLCAMYYHLPDGFADCEFDGWDFYEEYFVSGLIKNGKLEGTLTLYRLNDDEEPVKLCETKYKNGLKDGYEYLYDIDHGHVIHTRLYHGGLPLSSTYIGAEGSLVYGE